jgi:DNA-binding MarR family transcriptional regulator
LASGLKEVDRLNRLVHEPARLVILTALASCASADFVFLQRITGLTNGNLSAHLAKLSEAGLVVIEKRFIERKPNTQVVLTPRGRRAVNEHWRRLEQLRAGARGLRPRSP